MIARMWRVLALISGAVMLGGCPPPDGYVASTPAPAAKQEPVTDPPVQAHTEPEEPISSGPMQLPALSDIAIVRKNLAEGPSVITVEMAEIPEMPTKITNQAEAERLFGNSGITLQWIGWEKRGPVLVLVDENDVWWLTAEHRGADGAALKLEGRITEIGPDHFLFDGEITIMGTPDVDRFCDQNKEWRFAVTQNRKYYRLREFEWCDGLTDYIDIYF